MDKSGLTMTTNKPFEQSQCQRVETGKVCSREVVMRGSETCGARYFRQHDVQLRGNAPGFQSASLRR